MVKKQSFLSNMLGEVSYNNWRGHARIVIAIGSLILLCLFVLSAFYHSIIISIVLKLTTGLSLLFIIYVIMWILLLDIKVSVDEPETYSWKEQEDIQKPISYKLSTLWFIILVLLGISAIYFSNKYKKQYIFECDTFLVDRQTHTYHLDWTECDNSKNAVSLDKLQGYQIEKDFSLCEECKEIAEEANY